MGKDVGLPRGFRARTLVTARIAAKAGWKLFKKTVKPNGEVAMPEGRELDLAVAAAEKLRGELDGLKGLVMKFGQMASYLDGALPDKAQQVLAKLLAEATPMPFDLVAEVCRAELGAPPQALFDDFERTPFAAASIGQVHRARHGGRAVAVKLQYPGVEDTLKSDLKTIAVLGRLAMAMSPLDGAGLVDELRTRVLEECDYVREAENQRLFAGLLGRVPGAAVPAVVGERSARRVLTSELAPGRGFFAFRDGAGEAERARAGATIFSACFGTLFGHGVLNADPHPGNYVIADDGAVTFLDFGCVRRFPRAFVDNWKQLAHVVLDGKRAAFPEAYLATGLVAKPKGFDWDYQWGMMRYLYEPYLGPQPYQLTQGYVARSFGVIMWKNPNKYRQAMPREWLFANRLQWGLYSVLSLLGARARYGDLLRAALEPPPLPDPAVT